MCRTTYQYAYALSREAEDLRQRAGRAALRMAVTGSGKDAIALLSALDDALAARLRWSRAVAFCVARRRPVPKSLPGFALPRACAGHR